MSQNPPRRPRFLTGRPQPESLVPHSAISIPQWKSHPPQIGLHHAQEYPPPRHGVRIIRNLRSAIRN
jgi:hypothetical protein